MYILYFAGVSELERLWMMGFVHAMRMHDIDAILHQSHRFIAVGTEGLDFMKQPLLQRGIHFILFSDRLVRVS